MSSSGASTAATAVQLSEAAAPLLASRVTRGLYARTQPTPTPFAAPIRPLVKDPNTSGVHGTGRLWVSDQGHDYIAYSDDDGATLTLCGINPDHSTTPSRAVQGLVVTTNYFWLYTCSATETPASGRIWRAPYSTTPGALAWTLIWDANGQALGTGGAATTANPNSALRNSSVAVSADETVLVVSPYGIANTNTTRSPSSVADGQMAAGSVWLYSASAAVGASDRLGGAITVAGAGAAGGTLTATIDHIASPKLVRLSAPAQTAVTAATVTFPASAFGAGVIVGGPQVFVCANPTTATPTFAIQHTFRLAKHAHAVHFINGTFWISTGDVGASFTDQPDYYDAANNITISDVGLWRATSQAGTVWTKVSMAGQGGITALDPINFQPVTIGAQPALLLESDNGLFNGPLLFGGQTGTGRVLVPQCQLPWPYLGTMRQLGIDPATGNAYWLQTGESGGVGPNDSVVMSAAPYTVPIILETEPANTTFNGTYGDPVISNGYFWLGTYRCTIEKLKGQN